MDYVRYMNIFNRKKRQKEAEEEEENSNSPYTIATDAFKRATNQPLNKPKKADSEQDTTPTYSRIGESPALTAFNKQLKALSQPKKTRKKKVKKLIGRI